MKALLRAFGLTLLSLTLTNCSLSPEQIASRLKPSIVKVFYRNEPGHGTGFFVPGEKGLCTVLTAAHVVKKEGKNALQTNDGKVWNVDPSVIVCFASAMKEFKSTITYLESIFVFISYIGIAIFFWPFKMRNIYCKLSFIYCSVPPQSFFIPIKMFGS